MVRLVCRRSVEDRREMEVDWVLKQSKTHLTSPGTQTWGCSICVKQTTVLSLPPGWVGGLKRKLQSAMHRFCPGWLGLSTQNRGQLALSSSVAGCRAPSFLSSSTNHPAASRSTSSMSELSIRSPSGSVRKFILLPSLKGSQCSGGNSHQRSCNR